jgi:TonB-dependent receptor
MISSSVVRSRSFARRPINAHLRGRAFGRFFVILAFACLFAAGLQPLPAQTQGGVVEGRIQNAVTGDYLNKARVSVKGSDQVAFTNDEGFFRLAGLPEGVATLRVFYTGLDEQEIAVNVAGGQTVERDISLTSKERYGETSDTVKLDKFVVESTKETNARALAVNEQRFSANQKRVVSADQFGTIPDSNPGELMKWLPGVSVEYFANNIVGVSVRGLDSVNTEMTFDGMPEASVSTSSTGRGFEMRSATASDISRVEIRNLPLPEDSANTLGGSINLVRRSAFEASKRRIDYNALFTTDAESFTLKERDGPKDRKMQYWRPNWRFSWTEPVTKNFGFAFTIGHDDVITRVHWSFPSWNFGNATQAAAAEAQMAAGQKLTTISVYNPARTKDLLHDNPILDVKDYATLKFDWRPVPDLKLSYAVSGVNSKNQTGDENRFTWNAGSSPVYNDQFSTLGASGAGVIQYEMAEGWRDAYNPKLTNTFEAEWKKNDWTLSARGTYSATTHTYRDTEDGFFAGTSGTGIPQTGIGTGTANPRLITVNLLNQTKYISQNIEARDAATGQLIDWSDPANMNIGGAVSKPGHSKENVTAFRVFAKRAFRLSNPLSVQVGFDFSEQYRNRDRSETNLWTFVGADHIAKTADDNAGQIRDVAVQPVRDTIYNAPPVGRISLSRLYKLYQDHPDWFVFNAAESYKASVTSPFEFDEKTYAPYAEFFGSFFHGRLGYAGGVRYERSDAWAYGSLDRGTKVVPTGLSTFDQNVIRYVRKGAHGEGSNHNYFPSLHLNYNITPNLIFRIGYAKTQAKNRFDRSVIPSTSVSDSPPTTGIPGAFGTLNVRNTELRPWVGYNYETHLEYYTPQGGVIGAGVYRKSIHDFQVTRFILLDTPAALAEWGFDPQYLGYQVSTLENDGNARLDGAEFEVRQPLDVFLPHWASWARGFEITGSFNYNDLKKRPGENISNDFSTFYEKQTKAFLSYRHKKLSLNGGIINYGRVYRQREDAAGHYGVRIYPPYNQVDFNMEYSVTKWAKLFFSGRNVTGTRKLRERVVEGAPEWSRVQIENNLGVTYTAGVTGSF